MKYFLKKWSKGSITRYYLTDEGKKDLGFFEEREASRGTSYYDRHRAAKGDLTKVTSSDRIKDFDNKEKMINLIYLKNIKGDNSGVLNLDFIKKHAGGVFHAAEGLQGKGKAWVKTTYNQPVAFSV